MHNLFIVTEIPTGLRFYDQHNLCERIIYEKLVAKIKEESLESQYLLVPLQLNFNSQDDLESIIAVLEKIGFELSNVGNGGLLINALPADIFNNPDKEKMIQGLIEDLLADDAIKSNDLENQASNGHYELRKKALIYTACRSSVMAGERLDMLTINQLMTDWQNVKLKETCPHGRPIYFDLPLNEMKKKVKR